MVNGIVRIKFHFLNFVGLDNDVYESNGEDVKETFKVCSYLRKILAF